MLLEFVAQHPSQDFTLEDLPLLAIDLPSRRKVFGPLAVQDSSLVGDPPVR